MLLSDWLRRFSSIFVLMKTDNTSAKEIAENLLKIGAIKLQPNQPFRWASGWDSPIYCDNRLALSFPEIRTIIKNKLAEKIQENFPDVECIAGVATAGIPQGALIADALNLPFIYVRPKPKDHGLANLIEGKIIPGQKVVVIEDLISTGGSSLKAVEELKNAGFTTIGMAAIFTYGFEISEKAFQEAQLPLLTLSNYNSLIEIAVEKQIIDPRDLESLKIWSQNPSQWKPTNNT
jgi:orotate phosphoribosyltransferase